ncbi:related to E3 ubiquitin-protein ligase HUL5 [Zygosaccharomyces bailii ISA1307]|nr:related to E3 ubiquitin-protein ligase HUL5 [Zygosaccharomyces bailii ISA1307]
MLNFTGHTRRRNINLGNRTATSKRDLLLKAKQERDKRAQERESDSAARVIQAYVRKYLTCDSVLKHWNDGLNTEEERKQIVHLIPAFGPRIYVHLNSHTVLEILRRSQKYLVSYPNEFGNIQLAKLMGSYDNDILIEPTLASMNVRYRTLKPVVEGLIEFLKHTETLSQAACSRICELLLKWESGGSEELVPLFELNPSKISSPSPMLEFYKCLGLFELLPKITTSSSLLIENLSYVYVTGTHSDEVCYCIALCFRSMIHQQINPGLQEYFAKLYEKPFIDRLAKMVEDERRPDVTTENILHFMESAPEENMKNSILMTLLSRPLFFQKLFADVQSMTLDLNSMHLPPSYSIFIKLLEMYLMISTDHELLSETSGFTMGQLITFTTYLKNFVFSALWDSGIDSKSDLVEGTLSLLHKIYLRDSRLHFCSNSSDPDYWSNKNPEFLTVGIFKYIEDYERLYRDFTQKKEEAYSNDEDQTVVDEMSSMKFKILNQLSTSFKHTAPTRQFRKLQILIRAPFFIPFDQRVDLFYSFISLDKQRLSLDEDSTIMNMFAPWGMSGMGRQSATISREHMLEDACNAFNSIGERFKAKLAVTFVNEFGPEVGIDGGGITKEFLTSVSDEGFNSDKYGLFQTNDNYELYPATNLNPQQLRYLWFLGKVLGKCLYDHVLIDVTFADFFLKKLLNYSTRFTSSIDDMCSLDPTLYSNLVKLLSMSAEEIDALELSFEVSSETGPVELVPHGSQLRVQKDNVLFYIVKVADYKLNQSLFKQVFNFHGGISMIIAPHWMEMFNSVELQMLISGKGKDIDLQDLKDNTEYGGFLPTDTTIVHFWQILAEFNREERFSFIKFVTSVPRAPLQGFRSLEPKFGIRNAGSELDRLPTASTCVNLLKLPDYQNKELLRQKLLYAINSGARFDLS